MTRTAPATAATRDGEQVMLSGGALEALGAAGGVSRVMVTGA